MTERGGRGGEDTAGGTAFEVRRHETCGHAWIGLLRHVWAAGEAGMDDPGPIVEGPPVMFEIASLSREDPILLRYGEPAPAPTAANTPSAPNAPSVPAGRAEAADAHGAGQLRWVVELLRARPWTTSAWISLTDPGPPGAASPPITALSFRVRGYRLVMTAMFRSQNVRTAYLSYIPLYDVQVRVAAALGLPPGPLRVFVDVPHVGVGDIDRVAAVLAAQPEPHAA
ncbi:hypothetical protein [Actinomadura atramentaria]|uniref:hypothetical protein n=1 Tax=Actinomadura atramentaria TaxID=1990 RepID=UPI00037A57B2|nr:hypothetical protein [Actinomadura atramentaria]